VPSIVFSAGDDLQCRRADLSAIMPRFVILEHDHPHLHWDLMLEAGDVLCTWRLERPPRGAPETIPAERISDHRLAYLDYEGPVSGGRGLVKRWDWGTYEILDSAQRITLRLWGERTVGLAILQETAGNQWQLVLTPGEAKEVVMQPKEAPVDAARPLVTILAGPNGAGKSTIARRILVPQKGIEHFVNADVIAHGLSAFRSEDMAIKAGRVMLTHLHELAEARASFAFETTLASRTFHPFATELKQAGYLFHVTFLWLPSSELAIHRVRDRVRRGGHAVPDDVIRRRYVRGLQNFFQLYRPIADSWQVYDSSFPNRPRLIAERDSTMEKVHNIPLWAAIKEASEQ
jgi:predicted ABC-type ATPase